MSFEIETGCFNVVVTLVDKETRIRPKDGKEIVQYNGGSISSNLHACLYNPDKETGCQDTKGVL